MVLVVLCSILLAAGLVLIAAWGGRGLQRPGLRGSAVQGSAVQGSAVQGSAVLGAAVQGSAVEGSAVQGSAVQGSDPLAAAAAPVPLGVRLRRALRRYAWWATVITVASVASAILIAGAGGRLVMRVMAATSPDAVGSLTESGERVGVISWDGTFGLLVFAALPAGFLSTVLYALIHAWLPRGRLGGVVFGVLLLFLFGTTLEPLRAENVDFDIVGPGWLSAVLFSTLVILHGMLVAAVAGWYSERLPLRPVSAWAFAPLLAAVVYVPMGLALAAGGVLAMIGTILMPALARWWATPGMRWVGRAALVLLVVIAVPGFVGSIASIVEPR